MRAWRRRTRHTPGRAQCDASQKSTGPRVAPEGRPLLILEDELQADLHFSHRLSRGGDRIVRLAAQCGVRVVPDRVVQNVERLEPELRTLAPRQREIPDDRGIHIENTRAY